MDTATLAWEITGFGIGAVAFGWALAASLARSGEPADSGLALLDDDADWTEADQVLDDIAAVDRGDDSLTADLNDHAAWGPDFAEWERELRTSGRRPRLLHRIFGGGS
jgi:hypothetical protein